GAFFTKPFSGEQRSGLSFAPGRRNRRRGLLSGLPNSHLHAAVSGRNGPSPGPSISGHVCRETGEKIQIRIHPRNHGSERRGRYRSRRGVRSGPETISAGERYPYQQLRTIKLICAGEQTPCEQLPRMSSASSSLQWMPCSRSGLTMPKPPGLAPRRAKPLERTSGVVALAGVSVADTESR